MTSNTAPVPFVASTSSAYSSGVEDAFAAFDGKTNTGWGTAQSKFNPNGSEWINLKLDTTRTLARIVFKNRSDRAPGDPLPLTQAPRDFTVEGSTDGITYFPILTVVNNPQPAGAGIVIFDQTFPTELTQHVRITVTRTWGYSAAHIAEIELYGPDSNVDCLWTPSGTNIFFTDGNVGIGMDNPTHLLTVNGAIRAREIIVDDANWPDYVFAKNYQLLSLDNIEQHIKQKQHLPGIPSAREIAAKGVNLGEMQTLLLAKIEELTLHQIELNKRLRALELENAALKAAVNDSREKAQEAQK